MKKNELSEFKNLSDVAILEKVKDLKKELAELLIDKNMNKLKDLKVLARKRRDLAQSLTVVRQKQLLAEAEGKIASSGKIENKAEEPVKEEKKTVNKVKVKKGDK